MKIIDLLNDIANGEEVPKKIKYENKILYFDNEDNEDNNYRATFNYYDEEGNSELFTGWVGEYLNDEVKIIEDVEVIEDNKKIEKIDIISDEATPNSYYILNEHGTKCYMTKHSKVIADKLNETIDKLNEVLNDKD